MSLTSTRWPAPSVAALALTISLFSPPTIAQEQPTTLQPSIRACDRLGNCVDLANFQSQPTLYAYVAFWCDTWKPLLADLKRLHRDYPGLGIVMIAVDSRERQETEPLMLGAELPFLLLIDQQQALVQRHHITTVPTLLLQDSRGEILFRHQGFPGHRILQQEMAQLDSSRRVGHRQLHLDQVALTELLIPEERILLRRIHQERQKRGLPPLQLHSALVDLSRERLQRNLEQSQLSHQTPWNPAESAAQRGILAHQIAENLANSTSASNAVEAMLASPNHKANLLNPNYSKVGVSALRTGPAGFVYGVIFASGDLR